MYCVISRKVAKISRGSVCFNIFSTEPIDLQRGALFKDTWLRFIIVSFCEKWNTNIVFLWYPLFKWLSVLKIIFCYVLLMFHSFQCRRLNWTFNWYNLPPAVMAFKCHFLYFVTSTNTAAKLTFSKSLMCFIERKYTVSWSFKNAFM